MKKSIDIKTKIYHFRGKSVMLDEDLAELYGVSTGNLNKAIKRNIERFPEDFMFKLTKNEVEFLRFQIGISKNSGRGGRRYLPHVFTEQGIAMLSSVLNSDQAIHVNIQIMRAFVSMRRMAITNHDLRHKIEIMEKKYDAQFRAVFTAIKQLISPPPSKKKRRIGFHQE